MTAAELYEIVKGWPREALPTAVTAYVRNFDPGYIRIRAVAPGDAPHCIEVDCFPDDVVGLFEASGMRWLESWKPGPEATVTTYVSMWQGIETDHPEPWQWCCSVEPEHSGAIETLGLTKLHAISAALAALASGGGEGEA